MEKNYGNYTNYKNEEPLNDSIYKKVSKWILGIGAFAILTYYSGEFLSDYNKKHLGFKNLPQVQRLDSLHKVEDSMYDAKRDFMFDNYKDSLENKIR